MAMLFSHLTQIPNIPYPERCEHVAVEMFWSVRGDKRVKCSTVKAQVSVLCIKDVTAWYSCKLIIWFYSATPRANFLQISNLKSILYFSDIYCLKKIKRYKEKMIF